MQVTGQQNDGILIALPLSHSFWSSERWESFTRSKHTHMDTQRLLLPALLILLVTVVTLVMTIKGTSSSSSSPRHKYTLIWWLVNAEMQCYEPIEESEGPVIIPSSPPRILFFFLSTSYTSGPFTCLSRLLLLLLLQSMKWTQAHYQSTCSLLSLSLITSSSGEG